MLCTQTVFCFCFDIHHIQHILRNTGNKKFYSVTETGPSGSMDQNKDLPMLSEYIILEKRELLRFVHKVFSKFDDNKTIDICKGCPLVRHSLKKE